MAKHRPIEAGIRLGDSAGSTAETTLRRAFSNWASGVAVLAVRHPSGVSALTVSAFAPLSLRPPLVLACVGADAPLLSYLADTARFVVNLLAADQRGLATRFADRFTMTGDLFGAAGDPILDGIVGAFVCTCDTVHPGGDHRIVVGAVQHVVEGAGEPLLYHARDYRRLG